MLHENDLRGNMVLPTLVEALSSKGKPLSESAHGGSHNDLPDNAFLKLQSYLSKTLYIPPENPSSSITTDPLVELSTSISSSAVETYHAKLDVPPVETLFSDDLHKVHPCAHLVSPIFERSQVGKSDVILCEDALNLIPTVPTDVVLPYICHDPVTDLDQAFGILYGGTEELGNEMEMAAKEEKLKATKLGKLPMDATVPANHLLVKATARGEKVCPFNLKPGFLNKLSSSVTVKPKPPAKRIKNKSKSSGGGENPYAHIKPPAAYRAPPSLTLMETPNSPDFNCLALDTNLDDVVLFDSPLTEALPGYCGLKSPLTRRMKVEMMREQSYAND